MSIVDKIIYKILGTPHERKIKTLQPIIDTIHELA
jgi:hypothetical protein